MAFPVLRNTTGDTTGGSVVTSSAFTPGSGELLAVFVSLTATSSDSIRPLMTGSAGMSFFRSSVYWGGAAAPNFLAAYVAAAFSEAVSQTVSIDWGANTATGASFIVVGIQGLQKVGSTTGGILGQGATESISSQVSNVAAIPTYASAPASNVNNLVMCCVASLDNPPTVTPPTNFTTFSSTGYATPAAGLQVVSRQYGGAPAALAWGGTATGPYGSLRVEFDCSNLGSLDRPLFALGSGI